MGRPEATFDDIQCKLDREYKYWIKYFIAHGQELDGALLQTEYREMRGDFETPIEELLQEPEPPLFE